jgi:hypothetical protein
MGQNLNMGGRRLIKFDNTQNLTPHKIWHRASLHNLVYVYLLCQPKGNVHFAQIKFEKSEI